MDSSTRLYSRTLKAREQQALQLVEETPGITLGEVQAALNLSDAAMRRLTSGLRGQVRFEQPPLPEPAELEPKVTWRRETPRDVLVARAVEEARERVLASIVEPRVAGHLATYRVALDTIDELHQRIADGTNIDLAGDTRWAAMWQLAGRTLGFARALIVLAEAGIGDEAMPTARAQHECSRLLEALNNRHETDLLVRWLADDERYPKPHEVRAAIERGEQLVNAEMIAAGEEPVPTTRDLSASLYGRMSAVSHNRRHGTMAVVSPDLRRMARGRHPKAYGRASAVTWVGTVVEEAVAQAGVCLVSFLGSTAGPAWSAETLQPTLTTFRAVNDDQPLDFESIARAAEAAHTS